MEPKNERTPPESPRPPVSPKRFRIQKLEERIAPRKGGIPGKPGYTDTCASCEITCYGCSLPLTTTG
jgi:hypothetical protein